jgi:hypothetical protein
MINEKTLELNITNELLQEYRRVDPKAIALGLSLQKETHLGYDSRILGSFPQTNLITLYQYKAPLRRKRTALGNGYLFHLNDCKHRDQHLILWVQTGGRTPNIVYYVLPCILNLNDAYLLSPNLLQETYFLDVSNIDPLFIGRRIHNIVVHPQLLVAEIFSESEAQVNIISYTKMKELIATKKGITIERFRSSLKAEKNNDLKSKKHPISCFITSQR